MPPTTRSQSKQTAQVPNIEHGKYRNGKEIHKPDDAKAGRQITSETLKNLPASAGFYVCSNDKVKVIKLGKAGVTGGLRARVTSLSSHWGGDLKSHHLRIFNKPPVITAKRLDRHYVVSSASSWATKFETDVMREMGARKEFYKLTPQNIGTILNKIDVVVRRNTRQNVPITSERRNLRSITKPNYS